MGSVCVVKKNFFGKINFCCYFGLNASFVLFFFFFGDEHLSSESCSEQSNIADAIRNHVYYKSSYTHILIYILQKYLN